MTNSNETVKATNVKATAKDAVKSKDAVKETGFGDIRTVLDYSGNERVVCGTFDAANDKE